MKGCTIWSYNANRKAHCKEELDAIINQIDGVSKKWAIIFVAEADQNLQKEPDW